MGLFASFSSSNCLSIPPVSNISRVTYVFVCILRCVLLGRYDKCYKSLFHEDISMDLLCASQCASYVHCSAIRIIEDGCRALSDFYKTFSTVHYYSGFHTSRLLAVRTVYKPELDADSVAAPLLASLSPQVRNLMHIFLPFSCSRLGR